MNGRGFRTLLLDIEGTVAPISFVSEVLFPFARREIEHFLRTRWDEPAVAAARRQIAADAERDAFSREAIVPHLFGLMDRDAKTTGLKMLQGLIWKGGYASGALRAALFPEVAGRLRQLRSEGVDLRIYSSGSAEAQKDLFAHTTDGDLTSLFSGYYDTTIGPKQNSASYRRIAEHIERAAREILFVSDVPGELAAARGAGMQTRLAIRPGNKQVLEEEFERITSLNEI